MFDEDSLLALINISIKDEYQKIRSIILGESAIILSFEYGSVVVYKNMSFYSVPHISQDTIKLINRKVEINTIISNDN